MNDYLHRAQAMAEQLIAYRRDIHMHPEVGFHEFRTARTIAGILADWGLEVQTGIAGTGVVTEFGAESGPVIGLRAELDALPLDETNEVDYRSQNPGVHHACGHDAHMASLLGATRMLLDDAEAGKLPGRVRILFQPAEEIQNEEGNSGARLMVEQGALKGVDRVLTYHSDSGSPVNHMFCRAGTIMAAVDTFRATITGQGGHGAAPHNALDPIWLTSQVLNALYAIPSRIIDPVEPVVVTVGAIHAGSADNVIPHTVSLNGTLRSLNPATRSMMLQAVENAFKLVEAFGGTYKLNIIEGYPVTVNNGDLLENWKRVGAQIVGPELVHESPVIMGAEDFSYMALAAPGLTFFLGGKKDEVARPHHSPQFDLDESMIPTGAAMLAALAVDVMNTVKN